MTDPVLVDCQRRVAYLTLNRPDAGNALDVPLARCLLKAVCSVEADPAVRCVVLRGNGRMFCAGGDVKTLHAVGAALPALLKEILDTLHKVIVRLAGMGKPVVTAIHGPTAGAGVALGAVGDIVLAEPAAHFSMAYSRIGLSPDGGATWLLPRLIGVRRAQELLLTNRRVSAEEAASMGLVTRVVAQGTLAQEVDVLATTLAKSAVGALGRTKRLLLASAGATLEAQLADEFLNITEQGGSAESREGIGAFVERREADFLERSRG